MDSAEGRVAVGWLVVEDLTMVLALVLLPALAPMLGGPDAAVGDLRPLGIAVGLAVGKVVVFVASMFLVGRRFVPWLLTRVARLESRELFTLAVLVTGLGVGALAAELFGISFALGAFFAGAVVSESELSHRAAADALPMQDAFAVLFFVSVGMLFDPAVLVRQGGQVAALVAVIVLWKSTLAFVLLRLAGQPTRTALAVGAALGQIGEFSFIVTALGVTLGLMPRDVQAVVVAAALATIVLNGSAVAAATRLAQWLADRRAADALAGAARRPQQPLGFPPSSGPALGDSPAEPQAPFDFTNLHDHVVLIGYGRVGATVAEALARSGASHVVVEEQERIVAVLRKRGERAIHGDATRADVLARAGIERARLLVVTAPEPFRARRIVEVSREANPRVAVAVRTHSAAEQSFFEGYLTPPAVSGRAVYAEREAALSLAHYALLTLGSPDDEADHVVASLRARPTALTETFAALPTQEHQALMRSLPASGRPDPSEPTR
jgi:CPA2 family monovalent cation:H+ antiporter-2